MMHGSVDNLARGLVTALGVVIRDEKGAVAGDDVRREECATVQEIALELREKLTHSVGDPLFLQLQAPAHGRRAYHCLVLAAEHWIMCDCPEARAHPASQMVLGACAGLTHVLALVKAAA